MIVVGLIYEQINILTAFATREHQERSRGFLFFEPAAVAFRDLLLHGQSWERIIWHVHALIKYRIESICSSEIMQAINSVIFDTLL